jgi:signal transduction histidine kinase
LLFNVLKHAQASCAKVYLKRESENVQVIVEDNGVGFAPDKLAAASGKMEGFGLFSIRERLNYFGGRMEIESTPGGATRIIMTLPVQPDQEKRTSRKEAPTPIRVVALSPAPPKAVSRAPAKTRPPSSCAIS